MQDGRCKEIAGKKLIKKSRNKNNRINMQEQITGKPREETIRMTHVRETEKWVMGCLERRQESSPAVSNVCATQI